MAVDLAVDMRDVTKTFGENKALDRVALTVPRGSVHGLVGENGAGKSTLMKVLYGMVRPDSGSVTVSGTTLRTGSTPAAIAAGVGMVHQHFAQASSMSVLENLALAAPATGRRLDLRAVGRTAQTVAESLGFSLDLRVRIDKLSVGARQRIEIVKALQAGADVLVLDEPTAVLAPREIEELIASLRTLAAAGTTVIFVSHKLTEVVAACDEVTVMRRGTVVGRLDASVVTPRDIATAMTGEEPRTLPGRQHHQGEEALRVHEVSAMNDRGLRAVDAVSLRTCAGEIVGIAGIEGNGQEELVEVLTGMRRATSGRVLLNNCDVTGLDPRQLRAHGLAHVPADRLTTGTAGVLSITDNLATISYTASPLSRWKFMRRREMVRRAERLIEQFDVRGATADGPIGQLSGGNMQKVVIARETEVVPSLLVVAHPTRGVDLKAIDRIHRHLLSLRERGASILLLSSELDEIMALSDRILVMFDGSIAAELLRGETDDADLGAYMTGTHAHTSRDRSPAPHPTEVAS